MKKYLKKLFKIGFLCLISIIFFIFLINVYIHQSTKKHIYKDIKDLPSGKQVVIVLGARVKSGGIISDMLKDRIDTAIQVVQTQNFKLLVSADNGRKEYDEVRPTRDYLIQKGIKSDSIFLDFAGFDTYDSLYRAKYIFGVDSVIISTQAFHLPRAIYICKSFGIKCYGIVADKRYYASIKYNQAREWIANAKAFLNVVFKVKSKFGGEVIPITGTGNAFLYDK